MGSSERRYERITFGMENVAEATSRRLSPEGEQWREVVEACVAAAERAQKQHGQAQRAHIRELGGRSQDSIMRAISVFCTRHTALTRDRGYRIRCLKRGDGTLEVWAEPLSSPRRH